MRINRRNKDVKNTLGRFQSGPRNRQTVVRAANEEVRQWALEHGCPGGDDEDRDGDKAWDGDVDGDVAVGGGGGGVVGGGGDAPGAPQLPLPAVGARVRCKAGGSLTTRALDRRGTSSSSSSSSSSERMYELAPI